MRRSILFSLMVIGAVIAVVAGASTFSAFTSTDNISGTVTAGLMTIDLKDGDDNSDVTLTFSPTSTCGALAPGDTNCNTQLLVKHGSGSNLEFSYVGDVTKTGDTTIPTGPNAGLKCYILTLSSPTTSPAADASHSPATTPTAGPADAVQFAHPTASVTGDTVDALDPTEQDTFTLNVSLRDDNACNGVGAITVSVVVNATQTTSPHD